LSSGEHKNAQGFKDILSIHLGINRGSDAVKTHFPMLKAALLPAYSLNISFPPGQDELSE
jgi:hypothetical protein